MAIRAPHAGIARMDLRPDGGVANLRPATTSPGPAEEAVAGTAVAGLAIVGSVTTVQGTALSTTLHGSARASVAAAAGASRLDGTPRSGMARLSTPVSTGSAS